jgi:flagellar FliJ protein
MQRFRFTLETLLGLRRRREEEARLALGRRQMELALARNELAGLGERLKLLQMQQKNDRKNGCDINSMRMGVAYRHKLKLDMLKKGEQIQKIQQETETCRKTLVKATQKVRSLELLRERRHAEWRIEYNREVQGFIDDTAGQAFIRKKRAVAMAK